MDDIFFVLRTGIPWRDLPERYGPYTTRYNRWSKNWAWLAILKHLQSVMGSDDDPDGGGANALQTRMIDSSAVRARRYSAGSLREEESPQLG